MSEGRIGEEKDAKEPIDVFPVDETPTPTRILKLANDLFPDFQDPKENPFDAHFRKATEAVKSGSDGLSSSLVGDDSLNTPSIFPGSALNTPTPLKSQKSTVSEKSGRIAKANKPLKPLLPNIKVEQKEKEDAQLLLKTANGQTIKLCNVPVVNRSDGGNNVGIGGGSKSALHDLDPLHLPTHGDNAATPGSSSTSINPKSKPSLGASVVGTTLSSATTVAAQDSSANDTETAERRERNRYSARRSRIRKQKFFDDLSKSQKSLMLENKLLRDEIVRMKALLRDHLDCEVTRQNKSQDVLREVVGSSVYIQYPVVNKPTRIVVPYEAQDIARTSENERVEVDSGIPTAVVCNMPEGVVQMSPVDQIQLQSKTHQEMEPTLAISAPPPPRVEAEDAYVNTVIEPTAAVALMGQDTSSGEDLDSGANGVEEQHQHVVEDDQLVNRSFLLQAPGGVSYEKINIPINHLQQRRGGGRQQLPTFAVPATPSKQQLAVPPLPPVPAHQHQHIKVSESMPGIIKKHALLSPRTVHHAAFSSPEPSLPSTPATAPPPAQSSIVVHQQRHHQHPVLLPRPPPPQTVAEDLTVTKKLPIQRRSIAVVEPKNLFASQKRKSESTTRPGKRNTLGQKLIDIKNKMSEDKHIDEFLQQIHTSR